MIIKHRINNLFELKQVPESMGIEFDIRSYKDILVLGHDPLKKKYQSFDNYLKSVNGRFMVINIKEEGLEDFIVDKLVKFNIRNYFFLDQSYPFLLKKYNLIKGQSALRFSEFESIQTVKLIKKNFKKFKWIWVDSIFGSWSHLQNLNDLDLDNFKLCLVSPEVHGRNFISEIKQIEKKLGEIKISAVCTKNELFWNNYDFKNL
jgi:hypothetical protein